MVTSQQYGIAAHLTQLTRTERGYVGELWEYNPPRLVAKSIPFAKHQDALAWARAWDQPKEKDTPNIQLKVPHIPIKYHGDVY